ncbi:MAG: hypothetical protein WB760_03860 [Xanthobacteraceae bacterium]
MINKSKFAFIAAVALASIASPAFAHAKAHHRHRHALQALYNHRPVVPYLNPDSPEATGGGSLGYNQCTGHARC